MSEILCSRCGTPFPQEKGKPAVTCAVCGQLRPDLDITLDDDDEGALGVGTTDSPAKAAAASPAAPPRSHVLVTSPDSSLRSPGPGTAQPTSVPPSRQYVTMSEQMGSGTQRQRSATLSQLIGPVPIIVLPLAAGMIGALKMLSLVDDFAAGSWYAVAAVLVILAIGTLFAGLLASGVMYIARARWKILLRLLFIAAAVGVAYMGVREIPTRVQVRENALPGIMLGR